MPPKKPVQFMIGMRAALILSRDSLGIRAMLSNPLLPFSIGDRISQLLPVCVRNVQNYLETLEFLVSLRETVDAHLKSGLVLDCNKCDRELLLNLMELADHGVSLVEPGHGDSFNWKVLWSSKRILVPQGLTFDLRSMEPTIFTETFLYDIHFLNFDLADKIVVDIGGFVGDSALYYARQGAYVYAYEPNPTNFQYFLTNLALNPDLKSRVKPFNKAAGNDGKIMFSESDRCCGAGHAVDGGKQDGMGPIEVESVSLDTILKENRIEAPYLLKADCKGCEVELVRQNAISLFEHVKIEYTLSGQPMVVSDLLDQLRTKGFTKFRVFKHNYYAYDLNKTGTLLASK